MQVRKSDGSYEDFDRKKLMTIVRKTFKSANVECNSDCVKEIVDSLYIYDGILCSSIRKQLQERFSERDERLLLAYMSAKEKKNYIKDFVNEKKKFIERYKKSNNTANATVDDNSNVSSKNIGILNAEIHKTDNIQISRAMVMDKLNELYPNFRKKNYIKDLDSHVIYKHDESSFAGAISPYCCSITMYPFLTNGIKNLGGLSAAPRNIDSFCGMFVNLIFAVSAQFAGACLYKDQELLINKNGLTNRIRIKDFVNKFPLYKSFDNYQGNWEYCDISDDNFFVEEEGKITKIKKVYRRKYDDDIYKIKTYGGLECYVSKDHKFKSLLKDRILEIPANKIQIKEKLFVSTDHSCVINKECDEYKLGQFFGFIYCDCSTLKENLAIFNINRKQTFIKNFFEKYFPETIENCVTDKVNTETSFSVKINKTDIEVKDKTIDFQIGFLDGLLSVNSTYTIDKYFKLKLSEEGVVDDVLEILKNLNIKDKGKSISFKKNSTNKQEKFIVNIPLCVRKYLDLTLLKSCKSSLDCVAKHIDCEDEYHTDIVEKIETFKNDDEYVYEIETETHWYNCGGLITHNCATPEFLLAFTYFSKKEWGEYFWKEPDRVISCNCSREKTIRTQIRQYFQQVVYSVSQPAASRGMQSAFWNVSYYDKLFFDGMFGHFYFPDGSQPDWESLDWMQREFMLWLNEERTRTILTFPVESFAMVYKEGKFKDEETFKFVCEEYGRGHSFFTYISDSIDSLSSCCRLKNKIQTKEFNFTNGNMGVMTGSKSVITLNLNRIIQDWFNLQKQKNEDFSFSREKYTSLNKYINKILDRVYKYHIAYNELLWDMYDAGLLPVYKGGFIDLNKQYLTIGINGLNQAAEFLGMRCKDNEEYSQFCRTIFENIKEQNLLHKDSDGQHKLSFNTECVPAESLAIKNFNWDKEDGYWTPTDTNLYASYIFKPNDKTTSVLEKIRLHGNNYIGDSLDGGSACHIGLSEHLNKKQYDTILKYAAENGCQYLTFNVPNCECEDCGYIAKTPFKKCPKCCGTNVSLWDRVIGYLTKIKNWSDGRQIEQKTRFYEKVENF